MSTNLDVWPSPLEKRYKDVMTNCKNDESMEIIFNYAVTKIIRRNFNKDDHIKVTKFLKSLIENMKKESAAVCNKTLSEIFLNFSISYNSPKDFKFADYLLSEAINLDKNNDKFLAQRGHIRTEFFEDEETIQQGLNDLYKAIEINTSNMYSYNSLINYYWDKQLHNQSIELLLNAIKKQPISFELHNRLAGYYLELGKTELFENEINTMKKIIPHHPRISFLIGLNLFNNKKIKDLEEYLSDQNKKKFSVNDYLYLKGLLLTTQNKLNEAIEIFEGLTKNGHMDHIAPFLAEAYFENAEYQKSINTLLKFNEKKPLKENMLKLMKLAKEKLNHK